MNLHEQAKTSLKDISFTYEMLNELDNTGNTVWHVAAVYNTLNAISKYSKTYPTASFYRECYRTNKQINLEKMFYTRQQNTIVYVPYQNILLQRKF